jgi:hypothetical protein
MPDFGIFFEEYNYTKAANWVVEAHPFMIKTLGKFHLFKLIFFILVAYLITIFGIQIFMRDRKPFHLERALTIWNASLAAFSTMGTLMIAPALYRVTRDYGIKCKFFALLFLTSQSLDTYTTVTELETGNAGYWQFLWACSKIPEFIDTLFIVLRKKPLITMHW